MQKLHTDEHSYFQDIALFAGRIIVAIIFLFAGIAKWSFWSNPIAGTPDAMVNLIRFLSIVEPLGAVAFAIGFLTKWAAAGFSIIMIGAILITSLTMGVKFFTLPGAVGWDYNLLLLGLSILIAAFGPGRLSLDNLRSKPRM